MHWRARACLRSGAHNIIVEQARARRAYLNRNASECGLPRRCGGPSTSAAESPSPLLVYEEGDRTRARELELLRRRRRRITI